MAEREMWRSCDTKFLSAAGIRVFMARKPKRRFRRYMKGIIRKDGSIGALGPDSLVAFDLNDSVTETAWLSSVRAIWGLSQYTTGADDGPVMCGLAHSDYTATEIEEWVENLGSWEQGDLRTQEIGRRKIRMVGQFENPEGINLATTLNQGKAITTKCGWMLSTGQTVKLWAYNMGTSTLTGTPLLNVNGHANLWPK